MSGLRTFSVTWQSVVVGAKHRFPYP
jgi:hypothetical protein